MNNRKKNEEPAGRFRNKPFDSLKTLKQISAPASQAPDTSKFSSADDVDDEELFLRAIQGTKTAVPSSVQSKKGETVPPPTSGVEEGQVFLNAMKSMGTPVEPLQQSRQGVIEQRDIPQSREGRDGRGIKDESPGHEDEDRKQQSSAARMGQLKRGFIRISAELDLHGNFKDEALARLDQFIADAYHRGLQAVLVITGKGVNSPDGPVLPGAVSTWLRREGRTMVAEFAPAPRNLGGAGAFVVFLRSRERGQSK